MKIGFTTGLAQELYLQHTREHVPIYIAVFQLILDVIAVVLSVGAIIGGDIASEIVQIIPHQATKLIEASFSWLLPPRASPASPSFFLLTCLNFTFATQVACSFLFNFSRARRSGDIETFDHWADVTAHVFFWSYPGSLRWCNPIYVAMRAFAQVEFRSSAFRFRRLSKTPLRRLNESVFLEPFLLFMTGSMFILWKLIVGDFYRTSIDQNEVSVPAIGLLAVAQVWIMWTCVSLLISCIQIALLSKLETKK